MKILAIETSCDETAAAVVEAEGMCPSEMPVTRTKFESRLARAAESEGSTRGDFKVRILSNIVASQIDIHRKFGGIFPEHASRAHVEKIIPVVEEALEIAKDKGYKVKKVMKYNNLITSSLHNSLLSTIDYVAITTGPGLIGSLLVGVNFAKTLAFAKNLPIIGINHWLGHIYSNWAEGMCPSEMPVTRTKFESRLARAAALPKVRHSSEGSTRGLPAFPALILIVSGGHTGLVLMKSHDKIIPLGETLDDAAGEAFDKVAKLLDLGYPGGPALSKAAAKFKMQNANLKMKIGKLPRSMLDRKDYNFSFSGLKTAVLYKVKELSRITYNLSRITSAAIAAEFQQAVIDILIGKTIQAAYEFTPKSICLCGGVSANKELREELKKAVAKLPWEASYHAPPMELTTDNAAMIGLAAAYHLGEATTYDKISANANLKL